LIDGKPYKTLRRHLASHGLTPEEYRQRYNLKPDYPIVSPAYSDARGAMMKQIGLGQKGRAAQAPAAASKAAVTRKSGRPGETKPSNESCEPRVVRSRIGRREPTRANRLDQRLQDGDVLRKPAQFVVLDLIMRRVARVHVGLPQQLKAPPAELVAARPGLDQFRCQWRTVGRIESDAQVKALAISATNSSRA